MISTKILSIIIVGVTINGRRFDLIPLHWRLEVMHMTDYEMLSIILGMAMLIVSIIALCLRAKK